MERTFPINLNLSTERALNHEIKKPPTHSIQSPKNHRLRNPSSLSLSRHINPLKCYTNSRKRKIDGADVTTPRKLWQVRSDAKYTAKLQVPCNRGQFINCPKKDRVEWIRLVKDAGTGRSGIYLCNPGINHRPGCTSL